MTEPRDSKITLTYSSKWNDMSSRSGFEWGESIPEESMTMVLPGPEELNIYQLFEWYLKFLRHFGFNDKVIRKGLANHLFDTVVTDDELREIGKENGFITESDFFDKVEEEVKKKIEAKEEAGKDEVLAAIDHFFDKVEEEVKKKIEAKEEAGKDELLAAIDRL